MPERNPIIIIYKHVLKDRRKKYYFNCLFITLLICILFSSLSKYHWFFSLFDHFTWHYFLISILMFIFYSIYAGWIYSILSLLLILKFGIIIFPTLSSYSSNIKGSRIFITTQNIFSQNSSVVNLGNEILKEPIDIVTLTEVTPKLVNTISNIFSSFSHKTIFSDEGNFGFAIFSKLKLSNIKLREVSGYPIIMSFLLEKSKTQIYLVHLPPPLWENAWLIQKQAFSIILKDIKSLPNNASYLIMGDFNLTPWSDLYLEFWQELKPITTYGRSLAEGSWPAFLPGFLRIPIDHIFTNVAINVSQRAAQGSDHIRYYIQMRPPD